MYSHGRGKIPKLMLDLCKHSTSQWNNPWPRRLVQTVKYLHSIWNIFSS
jgi:hypothetical protein